MTFVKLLWVLSPLLFIIITAVFLKGLAYLLGVTLHNEQALTLMFVSCLIGSILGIFTLVAVFDE